MRLVATDIAGTRLGRYTLVRALGSGGMAELFLARADGVGGFSKLVALKRILPHKANNERFVRMLLNEAKLVASLDHPNIAHVHDIDIDQGQYFFVMEYVHGHDLRRVQHTAPNHRLHLHNALHIAIGVCAGLHHAHEARDQAGKSLEIVHRDVSPSNVIISYDGFVKLVDFGVAKAASLVSETREGVIKGKYGYMSPEQCLGEPLDRRSDLFAVGIMLWELVTGRRLYKIAGELVTLQRIVYADAPPPSRYIANMPAELERIIMRALSRDRTTRYQTAQQIQLDLEAFAVESRLPVSPVAMGHEMRLLFRERIDAWQQAERAGRSLAEHLAEVSSEDAIESSEDDGLDGVIAQLDVGGAGHDPTAATAVGKIPQPPPARTSAPELAPAATVAPTPAMIPTTPSPSDGRRLRSTGVVLLTALAMIGVGIAAAFLVTRHEPADAVAQNSVDEIDAAAAMPEAPPDPPPVEAQPTTGSGADIEIAPDEQVDAAVSEPVVRDPAAPKGERRPKHGGKRVTVQPEPPSPPPPDPPPDPPKAGSAESPAKPPPVVIRPDAGPAPGTVDANEVRAVVRSHLGEIKDCVARARMENRDLHGRVTLRISLAPTGKVTGTSVGASTGATSTLEACFAKAVRGWTFPPPSRGASATISYPFAF